MKSIILFIISIGKILFRPFFPVKVYGKRKYEQKKRLVTGNHISGWDPILFTMYTNSVRSFVFKAEFKKSWFLRNIFRILECVPVRRGTVDMNSSKMIISLLEKDKTVCLFPEGTRNPNVDCLQKFRTGAALYALKTHAPILPFYIWDKAKVFSKNYMIIGEEYTLEEFYDKPITKELLLEATEKIKNKVDELRIQLNEILAQKGVKRRKRTRKEIQKIEAYNAKQLRRQGGVAICHEQEAQVLSENLVDNQQSEAVCATETTSLEE
ncbi:MAG: 1-acyl-sn-glycerol-3-phosphate acyltransferase [Clostridia bacterium]|nr:1-acyl-sn-glycerol-3-phosphate acyltransferase [Clostridia bacterium]MBQ8772100.1 1-acyl-sn-glycerol-3-phosphate acyltransferase [Clostridia bacterium]